MFLFEQVPGGRWAVVVAVIIGAVVVHRLLRLRRRREQLRRRRLIRARLHSGETYNGFAAPAPAPPSGREIDLTEPGIEIDLRDGVVYGSEITLESGDTVETGIVGPFPAD